MASVLRGVGLAGVPRAATVRIRIEVGSTTIGNLDEVVDRYCAAWNEPGAGAHRKTGPSCGPRTAPTRPAGRRATPRTASGLVDPACEGQRVVGPAGLVYASQTAGVAARPLYRCRYSLGHFDSIDPGCEGQTVDGLLGYVGRTPT